MSDLSSGIVTRFRVDSVTRTKPYGVQSKQENISLSAVHHSDSKPENKVFAQYTPVGNINIGITNPNALEVFEPGDEYEVVFRKIPNKVEAEA